MNQEKGWGWLWIVIGGIIVILLVLWAVGVFDRESDLPENARDEAEEFLEGAEELEETAAQATARLEARGELIALQTKLGAQTTAEQDFAAAADRVAEIRDTLADAYDSASLQIRAQWNDLENDFDALEEELRDGTTTALASLSTLIENLQLEVSSDANVN